MLYQRRNYFAAAFCLLFSFLTRALQTSGYSNLVCRCLCRSNPALDKLYTPTLQRKYEYLSKYNLISLLHDANTALNRLNRFCLEVPESRGKTPCSHTTQGLTKIRTQISTCRMIICFRCHRRHRYFRCTPFCMALFRSCKRSSVIRTWLQEHPRHHQIDKMGIQMVGGNHTYGIEFCSWVQPCLLGELQVRDRVNQCCKISHS